jgi:hypothetical protein
MISHTTKLLLAAGLTLAFASGWAANQARHGRGGDPGRPLGLDANLHSDLLEAGPGHGFELFELVGGAGDEAVGSLVTRVPMNVRLTGGPLPPARWEALRGKRLSVKLRSRERPGECAGELWEDTPQGLQPVRSP